MASALKYPRKLGRYRGRMYYRFFVRATQSGLDRDFWLHYVAVPVVAESPAAACRLIKTEIAAQVNYPTEIECLGDRGGITARFIGWDTLIGAKMEGVYSDWIQLEMTL